MNFSRQNCYVFVCHLCTPPELKIIQVKHKDHSRCHVMYYIHLEYTLPGLGPFLNNEIIQGMAYLSSTLALLKNSSILLIQTLTYSERLSSSVTAKGVHSLVCNFGVHIYCIIIMFRDVANLVLDFSLNDVVHLLRNNWNLCRMSLNMLIQPEDP